MSQMKELYEKVSKNHSLQEKYAVIMKGAEVEGEEVVREKLLAFAKEAGYTVTIEEMNEYFKELTVQEKSELSESELDMVAGGKFTGKGLAQDINSILSFGITCISASIAVAKAGDNCLDSFDPTK